MEKSIPAAVVWRKPPWKPPAALAGSTSLRHFEEGRSWLHFHRVYLFLFFK